MAEIKISELSVGDLVYARRQARAAYKEDDYPVQICRLSLIPNHGADVWINGRQYIGSIDEIEPIPLTPEILEKNGFVYSKVTRWYKCEIKDTQRTTIGVHFGLIGADRIEISSVDAFDEDWNTIDVMINKPIKGVHQLQHALRLAGVEKEIEL